MMKWVLRVYQLTWPLLGCVDELLNHQPYGCEMQECEKALAQFVIARSHTAKLFKWLKKRSTFSRHVYGAAA
jgi:hypothetical protein